MRTRTADWFVCKIGYEKTMEDGLEKKVKESYVVNGVNFTDAEAKITENISQYISKQFDVIEIDRAPYKEIFFDDSDEADKWYKSKLQFISYDENTDKEKKTAVFYLVQAGSLEQARKNIDEVMGGTMIDYVIAAINETSIMDVFE